MGPSLEEAAGVDMGPTVGPCGVPFAIVGPTLWRPVVQEDSKIRSGPAMLQRCNDFTGVKLDTFNETVQRSTRVR